MDPHANPLDADGAAGNAAQAAESSNPLDAEVSYISGVDSTGNAAGLDWWQTQASFPRKWGGSTPGTSGGTVQFSFYPDVWWTQADQDRIAAGLALWSAVTNIQFQLVPYSATNPAPITFHFPWGSDTPTGTAAYATGNALAPQTIGTLVVGETTFNPSQIGLVGPLSSFTATGGYGVDTIIHEEGHLLGLGHAGPYNGTVDPGTQQFGLYDSRQWSVMSYINPADQSALYHSYYQYPATNWGVDANGYSVVPTTWMPLDILAVQRLYGLPTSTPLSGGQVFGFHCNVAGPIEPFFDFTINTTPVVTLWDLGGGNTLDVSGWSSPSTIDLRPGGFSSTDGMTDNIAIAFGVAVDAAVGGTGDDSFTVNTQSDSIVGGGGADTVVLATGGMVWTEAAGAAGILTSGGVADTLVGIGTLAFTGGSDTIVAHAGGAIALTGGHDLVFLDAAVARLSLGGWDTVVGGAGPLAITAGGAAGSGGDLVFDAAGPLGFLGGATADTVVAAAATVTGGSGRMVAFGTGALLLFQGGTGYGVASGGSGRLVGQSGAGGGLLAGGRSGANMLNAPSGAGQTVVFAGGGGDVVTFANAAHDTAVLAPGAETVQGAAAAGGFVVMTGAADAVVVGGPGNDGVLVGHGDCTLFGGGGVNAFVFADGQDGGTDVIADWDPAHDYIFLAGYGPGADARAVASQAHGAGGVVVTLSDHTQITFLGISGVSAGNFF